MIFQYAAFACDFQLPKGVTPGQTFQIQQVATTLPNNPAKMTVSGSFIIQDACTINIQNLVYTPQVQQVYLYSSNSANINDSTASGDQISKDIVNESAFNGTSQMVALTKSIQNAKSLKLFGSQDNFVLAGASIATSAAKLPTLQILVVIALFLCYQ